MQKDIMRKEKGFLERAETWKVTDTLAPKMISDSAGFWPCLITTVVNYQLEAINAFIMIQILRLYKAKN